MIDEVVLAGLHIRWCGKVNTINLADILDLLPLAGQTNDIIMEVCQILLDDVGGIPRGIACDEDGLQDVPMLFLDIINHSGHLVQLLGADVRTMGEAEVDERVFAL